MNSLLGVIFIWMFVSVFTSRIYTELNRGGDIEVYPSSARLTHYHHHHSPSSRVIWSSVGDVDHFNDYHLKSIRGNREDDQGLAKTTPAIPLGKVLRALRRALVFLQRNYRDLNLDAVFATRMVEGKKLD